MVVWAEIMVAVLDLGFKLSLAKSWFPAAEGEAISETLSDVKAETAGVDGSGIWLLLLLLAYGLLELR